MSTDLTGDSTPQLLLRETILRRNVATMAERLASRGYAVWPHVKTHKSAEVARLQLDAGAEGLTASTFDEAAAMVAAGARRVMVAFPVVGRRRTEALRSLCAAADVTVVTDDLQVLRHVRDVAKDAGRVVQVLWEVDSGGRRLGTPQGEPTADRLRDHLQDAWAPVVGLMTFPAHAYAATDDAELAEVACQEHDALSDTAALLAGDWDAPPRLSLGSTPTMRFVPPATSGTPVEAHWEARPGNYVFHDATQVALGVASQDDCALAVLATVVGRPRPDRVIVDAGSKALGADRQSTLTPGFGIVRGMPHLRVRALFEQHGILESDAPIDLAVGDRLEMVPNHACAAANLHAAYTVVDDAGRVVEQWEVSPRGPG